jgi:O-antigen/teichoic acid export membrane protein
VLGGTALLTLGRVFGTACAAASLLVLARRLSTADFGRYTFWLALFLVLESLSDFGTGSVLVQRTAGQPALLTGALRAARGLRLRLAGVGLLLVAALALAFREPQAGWITLAAAYPATRALELSSVVFQNEIAWGRPVATRAAAAALRLGAMLGLVALGVRSVAPFLLVHAVAASLGHVALHLQAAPRLPRAAAAGPAHDAPATAAAAAASGLWAACLPLGLAGLCQQAYFHVDNLFVRALRGEEELGRYNACVKVFAFVVLLATHATTAALPWLAERARAGELEEALRRLARPLVLGACIGAGLAWPWAERLLALAFGASFAQAAPALRWLLGAAVVVHLGAALLTGVVALGRSRAVRWVSAAALAVNLAGNAVVVPRLGSLGAAAVTLATEAAVALLALWALHGAGVRPLRRPREWLLGPALFLALVWLGGALLPEQR